MPTLIAKSAPDIGAVAIAFSSRPARADVTKSVERSGPPKAQQVIKGAGNAITRSILPFGVYPTIQDPPHSAFQRHPSESTVEPSEYPDTAPNSTKALRSEGVPVAIS